MKVDLSKIDREQFFVNPHFIGGELCYLVHPKHIGIRWTAENVIFRSSVWTENGEPVSLAFRKFVNFGERPDLFPPPPNLKDARLIEKIDGSLLCVSRFKGQTIARTRGTVDASKLDNGFEINYFKEKYPEVFDFEVDTCDLSYIYEWTTNTNKIVLDYGDEPELWLTAIINHKDYSYACQDDLDNLAPLLGVRRPKTYGFKTLPEMQEAVSAFKGQEGVCMYYNNGQEILKVKSAGYLAAHKLKSEFGAFDKVVDYYFELGEPTYAEFEKKVSELTDFEVFNQVRGDVSRIVEGKKEVEKIIASMVKFVYPLKNESRKVAAERILQAYGQTSRSSMAFSLLSGKELTRDQRKKLLYQTLKD